MAMELVRQWTSQDLTQELHRNLLCGTFTTDSILWDINPSRTHNLDPTVPIRNSLYPISTTTSNFLQRLHYSGGFTTAITLAGAPWVTTVFNTLYGTQYIGSKRRTITYHQRNTWRRHYDIRTTRSRREHKSLIFVLTKPTFVVVLSPFFYSSYLFSLL